MSGQLECSNGAGGRAKVTWTIWKPDWTLTFPRTKQFPSWIYPKWSQPMYLSKDVSRNEYSSLIHNRMKQGKNKQARNQVFITSKVEKINCGFFKQKNTVQPFSNKPQLHAKAWINLPNNSLYKIIQTEERKYYMSPLILKVLKQTKLKCTVWSQQSLLCLESGGGNWHIKYSFEMLIIVNCLIWVLVTQMH